MSMVHVRSRQHKQGEWWAGRTGQGKAEGGGKERKAQGKERKIKKGKKERRKE
jgi:hypothetical protein